MGERDTMDETAGGGGGGCLVGRSFEVQQQLPLVILELQQRRARLVPHHRVLAECGYLIRAWGRWNSQAHAAGGAIRPRRLQ